MLNRSGPGPIFPGMGEHWATVSGRRLHYLEGGVGPALVLIHGIAASPFSFRHNCEELTREFRVIVPDLVTADGSGDLVCFDNSLSAMAARLCEFLSEAQVERAFILGSSYGGAVVMELAAKCPEIFDGMVLVSPANPFAESYKRVLRFYLSSVGSAFARLAPFMPSKAWDYGIGRMYADPRCMIAGTGHGYAQALRRRGAVSHILSCLKTLSEDIEALRPKLATMGRIPTLLVWGDRDPVVEIRSGHELQRALAAKMAIMPGVGHLPYEENPAEFNRILFEWMKKNRVIG